jgi:VanZ family protein
VSDALSLPGRRHRSSASPLALAYMALVLYASLYPFTGWRWPPGLALTDLARLPWPPWTDRFDVVFNLLGYAPLGMLVVLAVLRSGGGLLWALLLGLAGPAALSYVTELAQQFLPGRHPSLKDLALNMGGAAIGALLALALQALGAVDRWHRARERWFVRESAGGLALLALWPLALLFPAPVPLGLGQGLLRLREAAAEALAEVSWAEPAHALLAASGDAAQPMGPLGETLITALGLLAPCLVAYSVARPGWRRAVLALGAAALALVGMTLSTALNYGPDHAVAWLTPYAVPGLACGLVLALLLAPLPRVLIAGIGLMVLTGLVAGVTQAPDDPFFAESLQAWEQGRFVRFHGLAQWLGWLWPFAAIAWLFTRLAQRRGGP